MGIGWNHRIIGVPVIRSNPDKWNTRKEILPCNHLSSEYRKCGSACNHVAAVCIQFGLLKGVLDSLGLHKLAKTPWLDSDHKFWALLFAYCFGMIGYHMLIWMSGIERISPDLFEAATIDGANKPQQFRYMTVPLLKGVFKTNITMWTVSTAAFFVWSQLFSTVTADKATIVPVQYMYMHTFGAGNAVTERNAGYGAAIGIILCVCVVIVFSICNKLIKDDDLEF